jgi:hypothetical protein
VGAVNSHAHGHAFHTSQPSASPPPDQMQIAEMYLTGSRRTLSDGSLRGLVRSESDCGLVLPLASLALRWRNKWLLVLRSTRARVLPHSHQHHAGPPTATRTAPRARRQRETRPHGHEAVRAKCCT